MNTNRYPRKYALQLYIANQRDEAEQFIDGLRRACGGMDAKDIEIIDVVENPVRALENKIFATPTLVRVEPLPERRALCDFSRIDATLRLLDHSVLRKRAIGPAYLAQSGNGERGVRRLAKAVR